MSVILEQSLPWSLVLLTVLGPVIKVPIPLHSPQFSGLYIVSFLVITVGFVMFNAVPTYAPLPDPGSGQEESDDLASADERRPRKESATSDLPQEGAGQEEGTEACTSRCAVTYVTESSTKL